MGFQHGPDGVDAAGKDGGPSVKIFLRDEPRDEGPPKPVLIIEAACDHVGYVAANLAIRWHPAGDRVLYINQTDDGRQSLYEYDLATSPSHPNPH